MSTAPSSKQGRFHAEFDSPSSHVRRRSESQVFVVMGVSGCGKSSVASRLAEKFDGEFLDADDLHSEASRQKMASGKALTDEDRGQWLAQVNQAIREHVSKSNSVLFLACSALKQRHRDKLEADVRNLRFIHLHGDREVLLQRLQDRVDHFMPASLLDSQLATLEHPVDAIAIDVDQDLDGVVGDCKRQMQDCNCLPNTRDVEPGCHVGFPCHSPSVTSFTKSPREIYNDQ